MIRTSFVTLLLLLGLMPAANAEETIVGGVVRQGPPPEFVQIQPGGRTQPTAPVMIDFDEAPRLCLFFQSNPLRDTYQAQGVLFPGPGALNGGAVLDQCGSFGVNGHSEPNFLAFNVNPAAVMANGGYPIGPERLTFPGNVFSIEMRVGSGGGGRARLNAYSANDNLLGSVEIALSNTLQVMRIDAMGIAYAEINVFDQATLDFGWVVDDLTFDTAPTDTRPASWGALKVIYR